ncbi:hypothetical protein TNCV_3156681 [Trichonephila clavipes]|nr:hypothetical protein TNCV_3156681 [Trichonephila clavipes]
MIVCPQKLLPHTVTSCEIAVCRSTINAGSDRCASRHVCGGHQHYEYSSLKMTRLQSVTLQVARGRQKSSRHCL